MNPYKVLGLRPNASAEDIKSAYQKIIDDYDYNSTEDLENKFFIEDKLAEVNDAYNSLMNNLRYKNIRRMIESDEITIAETELNLISDKNNAEWNYLRGFVMIRKGSYSAGIAHLRKANELNPTNPEYKQTISILNQKLDAIKANYAKANTASSQPQGAGGGGDMCGSPNSGGSMGMPNMGGMPNLGGMPNMNGMPNMGGGMPNMGGMPGLGGMPNMGGGNNNLQNQLLQNMLMNGGGNMCGNAGGGGGGMC